MAEPIRVQKAISRSGLMSRRAAEEAIAAGRVMVGGRVAVLGDRVDVEVEPVLLDGAVIPLDPARETHLLFKPMGVISTAGDTHGRETVVALVPSRTRLFPVGRLDADSEGLILLTNDGDLANMVTHPRYGITKRYVALVDGRMTRRDVGRLTEGVQLEDGMARALSARVTDSHRDQTTVELIMAEGRNREIRRMVESLGYRVVRLIRTAIGPISDSNLRSGESRPLSSEEIWALAKAAKGS